MNLTTRGHKRAARYLLTLHHIPLPQAEKFQFLTGYENFLFLSFQADAFFGTLRFQDLFEQKKKKLDVAFVQAFQ